MTTTDPMKAILETMKLETNLFPPTSRYYGVETVSMEMPDGQTVIYLRRRFVPQPDQFETIAEHSVSQGDRPDNAAARYLGDPEQFWRLADANNALHPDELTEEVGHKLRITQPSGLTGAPNA